MKTLIVTFHDGTTEEHRCQRYEVRDEILCAWTDPSWGGGRRDQRNWPLAGVREFHWADR